MPPTVHRVAAPCALFTPGARTRRCAAAPSGPSLILTALRSRFAARSVPFVMMLAATPAFAQEPPTREPIGLFAVDLRGVVSRHPQDKAIAAFHGVKRDNVPSRGLGLTVGAHVYALRKRSMAVGLGGELLLSRASRTEAAATEGAPEGPTVRSRLKAISPQVSLNFGHRQGWSYISGGLGWSEFRSELADAPVTDTHTPRTRTINYGGGARWFMKKHVAFTLDLRFWKMNPTDATAAGPALPRTRLVMMSAGVSFK